MSDNPTKQGRKRPWVRFERENVAVTVHMDRNHNNRGQQVLAVEDDTSGRVFDMIEADSSSASQAVELLESVGGGVRQSHLILEVTTDHGSEFVNLARMIDHISITNSNALSKTMTSNTRSAKSGRSQLNRKTERFFQTYEKHRQRFGILDEFLTFYNEERPHMSLD